MNKLTLVGLAISLSMCVIGKVIEHKAKKELDFILKIKKAEREGSIIVM